MNQENLHPGALQRKYTWVELCDVMHKRLEGKFKTKKDGRKFKEWFLERESLGHHFDHLMLGRLWHIHKEMMRGMDHFMCISGPEGVGKTTLGVQIASWLCPATFNNDSICYTTKEFYGILYKRAKEPKNDDYVVIIMDEGSDLISSNVGMYEMLKLRKLIFMQRELRVMVIICIPNFFFLDTVLRSHRTDTLVHILSQGNYKAFSGRGTIGFVSQFGMKSKNVNSVTVRHGSFWLGNFNRFLPPNIDMDAYKAKKRRNIAENVAKPAK